MTVRLTRRAPVVGGSGGYVPANRQTAKVVEDVRHNQPRLGDNPENPRRVAPPPMRPVPPDSLNLTGRTVGKLRVVGMAVERAGGQARWVCRCACGYYVLRSAAALKNADNSGDACNPCRNAAFLRRRTERIASGEYQW